MKRQVKILAFIICLLEICSASTYAQQSTSSCPIKIESVTLRVSGWQSFMGPKGPAKLQVRYRNISAKTIASGVVMVDSPFSEQGPVPGQRDHGELSISLLPVGPGKKAKSELQVFVNGVPNGAWLKQVIFTDGSRWESQQPDECSSAVRH